MGYRRDAITISASLSSNNDDRDERDAALWDQFRRRVELLAADPAFAGLSLSVD